MPEYKHKELTGKIIKAAQDVHNTLGSGFLEKVYQRAQCVELAERGIPAKSECPIAVTYRNQLVGDYYADIIVDSKVIIEVKAVEEWNSAFEAQLLNYLKATGVEVGLIINFGPSVRVKRMVT